MMKQHSKEKTSTQQEALDALIETERRRLSHAEAILMCLSVALDHCENPNASGFSDAADAAANLIAEAVDRLDSVNRDRAFAREV